MAGVFAARRRRFPRRKPKLIGQATDRGVLGDSAETLASTVPFEWGRSAGWLESNDKFTVEFLHGTAKTTGKLLEIRRTDDVISPAVDSRRELMAGLTYGIRPPRRFRNDATAQRAAIEVKARLESMPGTSIPWWVSEVYDHWYTSGFNLDEIVLDWANRVRFDHVRPGVIAQFNPDDSGRGWESVKVRTRLSFATVGAEKFAYTPRLPQPGEFWGESGVRCLLTTSETTLQLYSALLQSIRYSMGFPWLEDQGNGIVTDTDKNNALQSFSDVLKGKSILAYFGKKVKPQILSSQTPAMSQFGPLATFQAERKQAAARNSLANLGVRGVGARSLGETVHDSDMAMVKGHLDLFMRNLSGEGQRTASVMHTLAALSGYPEQYAPEIYIDWTANGAERKGMDHLRFVGELWRDASLTPTDKDREWMREQLQMPGSES